MRVVVEGPSMRSPVIVGQEGRSSTEGLWVMDLLLVSGAFTLRGCVHVIVRKGWTALGSRTRWLSSQCQRHLEGWCVLFSWSGALRFRSAWAGWLSQAFDGSRLTNCTIYSPDGKTPWCDVRQ